MPLPSRHCGAAIGTRSACTAAPQILSKGSNPISPALPRLSGDHLVPRPQAGTEHRHNTGSPQCHYTPQNPMSPTQAAVSIVHQEVSTQSPRRVVIHAARAVRHIAHHHRLSICKPAGGTKQCRWHRGGIRMAPSRRTSSLPSAGVPSPSVSPPARDAVRTGDPSARSGEDEHWPLSEMST